MSIRFPADRRNLDIRPRPQERAAPRAPARNKENAPEIAPRGVEYGALKGAAYGVSTRTMVGFGMPATPP